MSDKRLRLDLLPDGFLIEYGIPDDTGRTQFNDLAKFNIGWIEDEITPFKQKFRPALNHWHFFYEENDFILPDGLVVKCCTTIEHREGIHHWGKSFYVKDGGYFIAFTDLLGNDIEQQLTQIIVAVKIIGVTPEYAEHGSELGMEVIK